MANYREYHVKFALQPWYAKPRGLRKIANVYHVTNIRFRFYLVDIWKKTGIKEYFGYNNNSK